MEPTTPTIKLAIIGAGIGGLALAIGLRKQNVPVTIYEAASKFDAVGAGIGLGPNALRAMELMDSQFARLYDEVKVGNTSPERIHEQIEILSAGKGFGITDTWKGGSVGHKDFERSSAHRKALLEIMKGLIEEGTVKFCKRVADIRNVVHAGDKKVVISFEDEEAVVVDAVIGCDGIKGMTRKIVLQEEYPEEVPAKYLNTYVYRGITSIEKAKEVIGTFALDARWFMKDGAGWAMYPISQGKEVNIVAFVQDHRLWEGEQSAREVTKEDMMRDFEGFDKRLLKLLELYVKPMRWPLYHHPDTPTYYNQRVCLLGDVAHASSPSQVAGAGQGLEDALLLSKLLGLVKKTDQLDAAIQVYDSIRRPRAQGVVRDSADIMQQYFLVHPSFGDDLKKITDDANSRLPKIWWYDLEGDLNKAENDYMMLTKQQNGKVVATKKVLSRWNSWQCSMS